MDIPFRYCCLGFWFLLAIGCGGETLPSDVADYETKCQRMNAHPIARYDGDPHAGNKNVYACNVDRIVLEANTRPFPEGTVIVKTSTKEDVAYPWLIATARKQGGSWHWDEYTRNFEDEEFVRILASEAVCTDCHRRAERADWVFTTFTKR
jgi:hypothetical protein